MSDFTNFENLMNELLEEQETHDVVTVAGIKVQTGTKDVLDNFLGDYGIPPCPPQDELVVLLVAKDEEVAYSKGTLYDEMVYSVDTSSWMLEVIDGDFGNKMLVATFMSTELGALQDHYLEEIGDDYLDTDEGEIEFELVLCSDVGEELSETDLAEMSLSFNTYLPTVSFQEQVVGVMSPEQFLQLSNGLPIIDDRELE